MERYELAIVGGGMAGLTLISALEPAISAGMRVILIDSNNAPGASAVSSPSFDGRATALSYQTLDTLNHIGLTNLETALTDIQTIEVSDRGHAGFHKMNAQAQGFNRYGAVIANQNFGTLLWQKAQTVGAEFAFNANVDTATPTQEGLSIRLEDGRELSAEFTLLCDGGRSPLSSRLGFQTRQHDFNAVARVAAVKTEHVHGNVAFERFTENGPIALLPYGEYSALVWTLPNHKLSEAPTTREDAINWLNEQVGQRLGSITDVSDWVEYPLTQRTIEHPLTRQCLALGNTAATLHPVAGQGFNLAIRGIASAAMCLNARWLNERSLPLFSEWTELVKQIQDDQTKTVTFSAELIRLFGSSNPLIQLGRGIGLNSLDRHPSFDQLFALSSMGLLSGAPNLRRNHQEHIA